MAGYRPKRAQGKDSNHAIVRDYFRDRCGGFSVAPKDIRGSTLAYTANFRGVAVVLHDTAPMGGVFTDWLLTCAESGRYLWLEVKTTGAAKRADNDLTGGEKWLRDAGAAFRVVVTDEDVEAALEWIIK